MNHKTQNFDYQKYPILRKTELSPSIYLFELEGKINFKPGQFIQVALDHYGEITLAICSSPQNHETFEICVRGCGSTSNAIINLLPGDTLKIRGPYGNGWPINKLKNKELILIAGGMGIVPLRPLLFNLLNTNEYKKTTLIAGFKTPEHLLFKENFVDLQKYLKKTEIYVEHNNGTKNVKTGKITDPIKNLDLNSAKSLILMCGPDVMIPYCNQVLFEKGIKENQIYISYERRMECGIGVCQHCNCGKFLVCQDGPVFRFDQIKEEVGK